MPVVCRKGMFNASCACNPRTSGVAERDRIPKVAMIIYRFAKKMELNFFGQEIDNL
jgi:hypothetical protein